MLAITAFLRGLRNHMSSRVVDKNEAPVVLKFLGIGFIGLKKSAYLSKRSKYGSILQNEGKRIRNVLFLSKFSILLFPIEVLQYINKIIL
jgi:hypothetical protein